MDERLEPGIDATFEALAAGFRAAKNCRANTVHEVDLSIAGRGVSLSCIGDRLCESLVSAFRHLLEPNGGGAKPELEIDAWSGQESGTSCPVLPANSVRRGLDGSPDGRYIAVWQPKHVACVDRHARRIVVYFSDSDELHKAHYGKPLLYPLTVWCSDLGCQTIHAALVAKHDKGVLLTGQGGAGKSTVSLACVLAGYDFLGDDQIILEHVSDGFRGHSLFGSITLDSSQARRVLSSLVDRKPLGRVAPVPHLKYSGEKAQIQASEIRQGALRRSVSIDTLIVPAFDPMRTRVSSRPMPQGEAFLALVPGTMENPANAFPNDLSHLARFIRQTPCHQLMTSSNFADVAACIEAIVEQLDTA